MDPYLRKDTGSALLTAPAASQALTCWARLCRAVWGEGRQPRHEDTHAGPSGGACCLACGQGPRGSLRWARGASSVHGGRTRLHPESLLRCRGPRAAR